jgi:hypothetical protein
MMRLRSEAELPPTDWRIAHSNPLLLCGSCFSDRVGALLREDKFEVLANPFGTVYHPVPLVATLVAAASGDLAALAQRTFEHQGLWRNWHLTGDFAGRTREEAEAHLAKAFAVAQSFFSRTDFLVLTFGTAWGYVLKEDGLLVANCHKVPQAAFEKRLSTPEELAAALRPQLQTLVAARPSLRVVLNVSPVRHLRDGVANDRLSKSVLRLLCHQLTQEFPACLYFPSYELITDDLRDYRFFEPDLMHPTTQATEYVYERFGQLFFTEATRSLLSRWRSICKELNHRPQFPGSQEHQRFVAQLRAKLEAIGNELDVRAELSTLPAFP